VALLATGLFVFVGMEVKMNLHVIHNENKKLKCVFNTLVIKNESLNRSYTGGLIGFLDKHGGECNGRITVVCFMGGDVYDTADDLIENGLKIVEDFEFIDAGRYAMGMNSPYNKKGSHNVNVGVEWLRGRYAQGGIYVWYVDENGES